MTKSTWLYRIIVKIKVASSFPDVKTALGFFLTLRVINCSGERSFSLLKRENNCFLYLNALRTTYAQACLKRVSLYHSLFCTEINIIQSLNYDDIIHNFASTKASKKQF